MEQNILLSIFTTDIIHIENYNYALQNISSNACNAYNLEDTNSRKYNNSNSK